MSIRSLLTATALVAGLLMPTVNGSAQKYYTSAVQTGFLQNYHRLGHVGGVPLEKVWIALELDVRKFRSLYIAPVQIDPAAYSANGPVDQVFATEQSERIRKVLVSELQRAGIFSFVSDDPYFSLPRRETLTLQVRITGISSGDPEQRYKFGFGKGSTMIQIEGKITDNKTCQTYAEFADRRNHPGDAMILGKKKSADSGYLLTLDTNGILRGVVGLFIFMREAGAPANYR